MLQTCGAQEIGCSAAAVAKGAIPADHDVRGADRANDDFGDEILGAFDRKGEIEMLNKQQIDAEPRQLALLDAERGQPKRFGCRDEHTARVRFEGQHPGWPARRSREIAHLADQHGVTAVQAVEIAHCKDTHPRG